jgi:hypothetical protein
VGDNVTRQYNIGSRSGSRTSRSRSEVQSGEPTPVTGSGMMPRGSYSEQKPTSTATGGRRTAVIAAGFTVAFCSLLIFAFGKRGATESGHAATNDPGMTKGTPEVVQLPQELRTVTIHSEPSHASVYDGPRRIGEAPYDLKLPVDSPGMTITLVHEGRVDVSYLVRPSDAPQITLRLQPLASTSSAPALHPHPHAVAAHPTASVAKSPGSAPKSATKSGKPKIEAFDDSATPPIQRPKVEAIDDDNK